MVFSVCPAGTWGNANMTSCTSCGVNTISDLGSYSCEPCAPGTESNENNTKCGKSTILVGVNSPILR